MTPRERIKIMTSTNDGFDIAEKDLEMRGPGEIEGTRQSGALNFRLADIVKDKPYWMLPGRCRRTVDTDPELSSAENLPLRNILCHSR